jgi:hypothetical protein
MIFLEQACYPVRGAGADQVGKDQDAFAMIIFRDGLFYFIVSGRLVPGLLERNTADATE